jgi:hypothetical protein
MNFILKHMLTPEQSKFGELDDPLTPSRVSKHAFHQLPSTNFRVPSFEMAVPGTSSTPAPSFVHVPSPLKYFKLPGENEIADDMLTEDDIYPGSIAKTVAVTLPEIQKEVRERDMEDRAHSLERRNNRKSTKTTKIQPLTQGTQPNHENRSVRERGSGTVMKVEGSSKTDKRPCHKCENIGFHNLDCLSPYGSHAMNVRGRGKA